MNEKPKIAVLGPLGTYTHEASIFYECLIDPEADLAFSKAALKRFGNDFVYDEQPSISGGDGFVFLRNISCSDCHPF